MTVNLPQSQLLGRLDSQVYETYVDSADMDRRHVPRLMRIVLISVSSETYQTNLLPLLSSDIKYCTLLSIIMCPHMMCTEWIMLDV